MDGFPHKESPEDWQVRIGQDELGRIFHLRDSLDQSEALIQHADRYREKGWVLEARGEGAKTLDFSQSSETWGERLMTMALAGMEVNLGIRTGLPSRLLVLETPRGETLLDTYGEWRSACRARAGEDWEQHYFLLPPASRVPVAGKIEDFQVRIYGQDGLVLAPPSRHADDGHMWTWVIPPWELPPAEAGPAVWEFLEDFGLLQEVDVIDPAVGVLPWEQVYALIAPHEEVIRTLLAPAGLVTDYYRDLANQARLAGVTDPAVLFALLWHAPQGDARTSPERLAYIRELAAAAVPGDEGSQGTSEQVASSVSASQKTASINPASAESSQPPVNDLVEFMENRVILDRSRYESMIYELAELTAKAEELQRRLAAWEERSKERQPVPAAEPEAIFQKPKVEPKDFPFDPAVGTPPPDHRPQPLSSLKTVVQEFLQNNADLAADPKSVQMLQFCMRNYIDLNPELNGLPLGEKLEMAGKMAREFLTQVFPKEGLNVSKMERRNKAHGAKRNDHATGERHGCKSSARGC